MKWKREELLAPRYGNANVLAVTGVQPGTLQMWLARGILSPTVANQRRGQRRQYSAAEMVRLLIVARLVALGLPVAQAAQIGERLLGARNQLLIPRMAENSWMIPEDAWMIAQRRQDGKMMVAPSTAKRRCWRNCKTAIPRWFSIWRRSLPRALGKLRELDQ